MNFLLKNKRFLIFSVLLTFFSGFGQTFLLALYVPVLASDFNISVGYFGSLYALATILSAFCIPYLGRLIDKVSLRKYAVLVCSGLVISLLIVSGAYNLVILFMGIYGLRLFGQGLMGHTSTTSILKEFDKDRGKALSISGLGYPLSQAILPIIIAFLLLETSWRQSMTICAIITLGVILPYIIFIFKEPGSTREEEISGHTPEGIPAHTKEWTQMDILKDKRFYLLSPGILVIPFLITGLFFYQVNLAEYKGWSTQWLALCYTGYAVSNGLSILFTGTLIDKYSAQKLFPFFLGPLLLGLGALLFFDGKWVCLLYLLLSGISVGCGSAIRSAIQAEIYGTKTIGAVRSLFATFMIIFTALGPLVIGNMIDAQIGFQTILALSFIMILGTIIVNVIIANKRKPIKKKITEEIMT